MHRWRRILVRLPLVVVGIGACEQAPERARVDSVAALPAPRIVRSDTNRLEFPRILRNFCEGEACYNYSVVACTTLVLRSADASTAPEVGYVNTGDTVVVETGNVHIPVPGLAIMRRAHVAPTNERSGLRLAAGDTLLLLEHHGEGHWAVGHGGRWKVIEEFWAGPARRITGVSDDKLPSISIKEPEVIRWLRLRPRGGSTGWWREEESQIARLDPAWLQSCSPNQ